MSDPVAAYYPWERELFDWYKAEEAEGRIQGGIIPDHVKTSIEDVLRCAQAARQVPEVWRIFQEYAERRAVDEEANIDGRDQLIVANFINWFRMKNDLVYVDDPFGYVAARHVLSAWAMRIITDADLDAARDYLFKTKPSFIAEIGGKLPAGSSAR